MPESNANLVYTCEQWEIDLGRRELRSRGNPVPLGSRAFEIVTVLVQSASELVTKDHLMERVWPGVIVGEGTIHVHISAVRKALGQDRGLLKTASGRGYRLLGSWTPQPREATVAQVGSPPTRTSGAPPTNNFPPVITRMIGRAAAAQLVRDLVSAYRVVTLTGPGGIGKTSLAIKAVRYLLLDFEDGGWIVELASLSDSGLVPSTVAGTLGIKLDGEISAESVARAVGRRHVLLVLDNCEHVIDAVANLVDTFTRLCPRTTIVATSREILRIAGESVYRVPPLDVPALGQAAPHYILQYSAVELFVARIRALNDGFSPHDEDLTSIATICRHLDGIPLAIELAAASAAAIGIAQVAAGLRDRFALLTRGRRTARPRQRTLRAALDWSHELLPDAERRLLRRLAVFAGGFTLDSAAAVTADAGLDAAAVTDGIASLITKSLIALDPTPGAARWRLLETVRAYALDKLVEAGEPNVIWQRHAGYLLEIIEAAEAEAETRLTDEGLRGCGARIDDIHAALDWCFSPSGSEALGVELTVAAVPVWMQMSQVLECRVQVQRALAASPAGLRDAAHLRMKLLGALAGTLLGGVAEALDVHQVWATVFDVAEELGIIDYQLRALLGMCRDHYKKSKLDEALILSEKFCAIAERSTQRVDRLIGQRMMGYTLHFRGEQAKARQHIENMLNGYDEIAHG